MATTQAQQQLPDYLKPRRVKQKQFFKKSRFEFLTKADLWMPWVSFLPFIAAALWVANMELGFPWQRIIVLFLIGFVVWTLTEYVIHRFLYHIEFKSQWIQNNIQYPFHWLHHQYPLDKKRLIMPPFPGVFVALAFFGFFYVILNQYAYSFFAGFLSGYLYYITLHYSQHRIKKPKIKAYQPLWQHHLLHHFKYPNLAFGVSNRMWDRVFGTMPPKQESSK